MLGLMVLLAIGLFLLVLIGLPLLVSSLAKRFGASKKVATWLAVAGFLLIFLSVFWDAIPTWIAFKYYADKEAGLKVYKTLEQWKQENPGVAETLRPYDRLDPRRDSITLGREKYRHPFNDRFSWDDEIIPLFLSVRAWRFQIVDTKKNEVLLSYTKVISGNSGGFASGGEGWWKGWLINENKGSNGWQWSELRNQFTDMGEKK